MRITKKTILAIGLIASSLTLNSCDVNDSNEEVTAPDCPCNGVSFCV